MSATEQSSSSMPSPPWLSRLLSTTPTFRCTGPHDKPIHEDLQPLIADLHCHPALEAALHLCNGDLYSAHFLVRKAQGGAKELDWGHAILHRLEGDLGNAKCWYTDLDNVRNSKIYTSFWAGKAEAHAGLTASQFVDLTAFYMPEQPSASEIHETSANFNKVKSAYDLPTLEGFRQGTHSPPLSKEETERCAQEELEAMVRGLAEEYGWGPMDYEESARAMEEQKHGEGGAVEHKAEGMILGSGNRKF